MSSEVEQEIARLKQRRQRQFRRDHERSEKGLSRNSGPRAYSLVLWLGTIAIFAYLAHRVGLF